MSTPRASTLPPSLPPRGLSREKAAEFVGVGASTFDKLVQEGRMPPPKIVHRRRVWDRIRLEEAFSALPDGAEPLQDDQSKKAPPRPKPKRGP